MIKKQLNLIKENIIEFKNRVMSVLYESEMVWTRLTLSCAEFIWGFSLLWPGETFERPAYSAMELLLSEQMWGILFLVTGTLQFLIMVYTRLHHAPLGVLFAMYNSSLWWFVVVSMYMSVYPPPAGISGELALAFSSMWIFVRAGCGRYKLIGSKRENKE